jgi:hypothetical protein
MRISNLMIAAMTMGLLIGCDGSGTSVLQLSGHYDGTVTSGIGGATRQSQVETDVDLNGKSEDEITLKDKSGTTVLILTVTDFSDKSLTLQSSLGMPHAMKLTIDPVSQCYVGSDIVQATLCAANLEVSLKLQSPKNGAELLSVLVYRANGQGPAQETPVAYTLNSALARARAMSFTSRIEYEHIIQAKLNSKAAYEHLLPQISLGTVANNITPTWETALQDVGDLAPFLLPNRWFQASAAHQQSKAEQDTRILMRLDMGVQVEGLFFAYQRDKNTRDLTQKMLERLTDSATGIRHQIAVREADGQLPLGSTANVDLLTSQVQQNLIVLDQVKTEDLGTISQTLGYDDPTTVTDASVPALTGMDTASATLDYKTIRDLAFSRSFERDQMDDLILSAKDNKKADYWTFLDPYGDPNLFLSFALPSELGIAQSQVRELQIDKQQLESILEQKALGAVTDYAAAIAGYKKAQEAVTYETKILDQEMSTLRDGVNVDFVGLSVILQQYLASQIAVESAVASYGIAQAEVNRLLLQGNYAGF